jgi:hypothetical protein
MTGSDLPRGSVSVIQNNEVPTSNPFDHVRYGGSRNLHCWLSADSYNRLTVGLAEMTA